MLFLFHRIKLCEKEKKLENLGKISVRVYATDVAFFKCHLNKCNAFSKTCYSCGNKGHVSSLCRLKTTDQKQNTKIHNVKENLETSESSDDETCFWLLCRMQQKSIVTMNQSA